MIGDSYLIYRIKGTTKRKSIEPHVGDVQCKIAVVIESSRTKVKKKANNTNDQQAASRWSRKRRVVVEAR